MTNFKTASIVGLALLAAFACGAQMSDEQQIQQLESTWSQKFSEKDIDWIVGIHADDAQQFPPNAPPVTGKEALRMAWQDMMNIEGFGLRWESTLVKVSESGDLAYDAGVGYISSADGTETVAKYVVVWEKQGDDWKVVLDMFSPNE